MTCARPRAWLWSPVVCAVVAILTPRSGFTDAPAPATRTFDVEAYDVDGAKLLDTAAVETAVYPFLGPDRTLDDIRSARAALQKAYSDKGYSSVVVELPDQTIADNIVRLHVVEETVGRLRVTGARYFSPNAIRRDAKAFNEGEVPNITQAQSELADLNRFPDRQVNPVLRAGVVPGTVDVDLKVSDTLPLHGSLELDNDHNQFTTPLRLLATLHYDNLWQLEHSVSFTYGVAPENRGDSEVFAGSYLAPVPGSSLSLLVSGYSSNSNVATLASTTVLGKGYSIGFRLVDQLPRLGVWNENISIGFDYKDFDQNIQLAAIPSAGTPANVTDAPVAYLPLTAAYTLLRDGEKSSTRATLSATVGTRGVGSDTAEYENTRANARPNFARFDVDFSETETLWRGFSSSQRLTGQVSDGPLVSSEEFSAGGLTSVRGYLQSEAVGDEGFTGAVELVTPSFAPKSIGVIDELRLYGFIDGGAVWVLQPLHEQAQFFSLASAGAGVRTTILRRLRGEAVLALPFIGGVATHAYSPRAIFTLKSDF